MGETEELAAQLAKRGLETASPGLADISRWPQPSPDTAPAARRLLYGGVAMKKTGSADRSARS